MIAEYWLRPPERKDKPLCECEQCNEPIFEYEEVREIERGCVYVHDDCFVEWARHEFKLIEITKEDI